MNVVGKLKGETFCESDAVLGTNIQHSGPPTYRGVREKFSRLLSVNISLVDVLTYMDPNVEVEGDVEINSGPASPHNQIFANLNIRSATSITPQYHKPELLQNLVLLHSIPLLTS